MSSFLNRLAFFLICAICVVTTLAYGAVHQPVIALFYLLVTLLVVIFGVGSVAGGEITLSRSPLQVPLLLLASYAAIQAIPFGQIPIYLGIEGVPRTISIEPFATQVVALHLFVLAAFLFVALSVIDSAARLRRIAVFLTFFGFLYAFYAILQSVLSPDKIFGIYKPSAGTPFGSFVNKHDFAAILEMTIAVPMGMLFAGAVMSDKRLLYLVAITLVAAALLLSGSRGGLVALLAEVIFIVILTSRAKGGRKILIRAGLSMLLLAAGVGGAIFVGGDTTLTRISETAGSADVTSNRAHIWRTSVEVVSNHFPLGAGLGAFPQAYTKLDTAGGYERVEQAHNDYLQIAADAGVIGILIGALFLYLFFREGVRNIRCSNQFRRGVAVGSFAGCFAILIHSLFDFVLHIPAIAVMFLTLLASLVAAGRDYEDEVDDPDQPRQRRLRSASVTPIRVSRLD